MLELEYQLPEGSLFYVRHGQGAEVTRYRGLAGTVVIPEELPWTDDEGNESRLVVREIAKKAFLSMKYLRNVTIPVTVQNVGDWAFAYCDALREVSFGGKDVQFGKAVFMECSSLRCLKFGGGDSREGIGELTATAVTQMDAAYLLDAGEAGSREWLEKWDARMLAMLRAADDEGYSKQILCGEEDYESADLETFLTNSRKKKVRLLMQRLLWPMGLDLGIRGSLEEYLLSHAKGCRTEETWSVVRDEYGDRREFYELYAALGCFTAGNAAETIADTREDCPEMKAFLLKYQADHFQTTNFFDDMEL